MGSGEVKVSPLKGYVAVSPRGLSWGSTFAYYPEEVWDQLLEIKQATKPYLVEKGWRVLPCTITVEEPV
jgi:hypothetical protein